MNTKIVYIFFMKKHKEKFRINKDLYNVCFFKIKGLDENL
jgi:hypothetical protein